MQEGFYELASAIQAQLRAGEAFTAGYAGEDTDFVRWNGRRIRPAGWNPGNGSSW